MLNRRMKPITAAVGTAFVASLAGAGFAAVQDNPFGVSELDGGYDQLASNDVEGKCGEGKCGEAKDASGTKDAEAKCGEGKDAAAEGKCGEGKDAAEGKCGESKDAAEGKCGEGKCGGSR